MPADKEIYTQTFEGGIITTVAPELMPKNAATYILNCNVLSTSAGNVGIITNVKGNVQIPINLPEGDNEAVGYAKDQERNNLYIFVWNSEDLHTIYRFNVLDRSVIPVIQNLTDTAGADVLNLNGEFVLHADVVRGDLLYWTQKDNKARKTNIKKCLDKTPNGYGTIIRDEYINAYKPAPVFAPTAQYFSDETKAFNRMYGRLYKFISRFIYRDGEKSNWSDYGTVPLPLNEPISGITSIPTNNNAIQATVETGSPDVKQIEIAVQSTDSEIAIGSTANFFTIALLNKQVLGIDSDSTYVYTWYNDQAPIVTDMEKVIRPYSFLPKNPLCQSFVDNALVYSNFKEGFDNVSVIAEIEVEYIDLNIDPGTINEWNDPEFIRTFHDVFYVRGAGGNRETAEAYTIGNDVKKGNKFTLSMNAPTTHIGPNDFNISASWTYDATAFDTASTVANYFRTKIYEWSPQKIYLTDVSLDFDGNASFSFRIRWYEYVDGTPSKVPIQFDSLKDTGESKNNIKLGSSFKFGIEYLDDDGRKSLVYTSDNLTVDISSQNVLEGFKKPVITLQIEHRPPIWAKYYEIVRTKDLIYENYIQMLIQDVDPVDTTDSIGEYLDLVVGSFFTYQKLHENTVLTFDFEKGDRFRLIKYFDPDTFDATYYPFYEGEIISYQDVVDTLKSEVISTVADSPTVTVVAASEDNIGKILVIDGVERTITAAPSGTTYTVDHPMIETKKYAAYRMLDRRGTIRISKPPEDIIEELKDLSLVEIYKPSVSGVSDLTKTFYEFGQKFPILNYGTSTRSHGGVLQNQDGTSDASLSTTPAIIKIDNGTAYVRNREMPITSSISGTMLIATIEDAGYSDFYNSTFNDNGRVTIEDTGDGEVEFGSRCRFSNNFIEDTRINGLNDFDNLDRADYNDQYGNIMRTYFLENKLFTFKELKDTWIPVSENIISQADGTPIVGLSSKLLNNMQYFAWEGGIGNNPESLESNGVNLYHVSTNSGVVIRLGGSGVIPISEIYHLDNEVRNLLSEAAKNGAKIIGGFDRQNGVYIFSIRDYKKYVFNSTFNESAWTLYEPELALSTTFEVVADPLHGDVDFNDTTYQLVYTPDTDYVGADHFTYRAFVNGSWTSPRKVCITVAMPTNRPTAWRGKEGTEFCVLDESGFRTGYEGWTTLEEYYADDNTATGVEKPNATTDANYVFPVQNLTTCFLSVTITSNLSIVVDPETGDQAVTFDIIFSAPTPSPVDVSWAADYTVNATPETPTGTQVGLSDSLQFILNTYISTDVIVLNSDSITNVVPDPVDGVNIIF